jgi:hypothetical protein
MQRRLLLVSLLAAGLLCVPLPTASASVGQGDNCEPPRVVAVLSGLPPRTPHPQPPVATDHGPLCHLARIEPPPPQPGETPTAYGDRLLWYYLCTDTTQSPPRAEVSDQCGPQAVLGLS